MIYLDNGATTMVAPEVADAMLPYFTEKYGNASSTHGMGEQASEALESSRETIAKTINASPAEIYFTGSATEALNLGIRGFCYANKSKGNHVITTKIEHPAVYNTVKRLEREGFKATFLDVDPEGFVDLGQLQAAITPQTLLVSVIHGNHEIGIIQDMKAIADVCQDKGIVFHTDACQSFTKTAFDASILGMAALNAHKIHGPKGAGALYVHEDLCLQPLTEGGPHEKKLRPGTENIPAIVGFAKAAEIGTRDMEENNGKMAGLRDCLIKSLLGIPDTRLNGPKQKRLPNNANVSFSFVEGESMLMLLNEEGICVSTGSACSSQSLEPSRILLALGLSHEQAHGSLRFTLSRYTKKEEIEETIDKTKSVVESLRKMSPLANR